MNKQEFLEQQKKLGRTWTMTSVDKKPVSSKRIFHCEPNQDKVLHFGPQQKPFIQHFYPTR